MSQLGIGLIGAGRHGSRYARHIVDDFPGLRLAALACRDRAAGERQATAFRCRWYGDYHDLISAPDVEAIVVAVPPTLHVDIIETAAAMRRPVLLEKPAAVTLDDGRRMLRAVRDAHLPLMVAQTLRYNAVVRTLVAARERIGRLHALRLSQRFEPSSLPWLDDPAIAGAGMLLHTGVHSFDLLRVLSGLEAERVQCEMTRVVTSRLEDNFTAALRLSDGTTLASVAGSRATAGRNGAIELAGEHGQLIADHVLHTAVLVRGTTTEPLALPPPVQTVRAVIQAFSDALGRGAPMPISLDDGLRAVAVAQACQQSAQTGRAVAVELI
ncbi:MAG: oxidoreductase domain protein [Deltaproteobacteria bacterium]|nr:oxidoreductase domain protein [Deltaproteobacteria bacterium]